MACSDILQGIGRQCKTLIGGNQKLYIFNNLEDPFTIVDGEATAINPLLTEAFEFDIIGDGHILEQNQVSDRNTFTTVNTQTLTALLGGIDATKNATLNLLVKGYPMAVIRDRNDNYHAVGIVDGIDFTNVATTGGAKTDFNGYTLTGVSITKDLAPILDSATVTAFLALVTPN
jgi:hypothetical protein